MKDKKSMVIVCLAVLIIKVLGGLLTKSFTLISTGILEGVLLTYFLLATNKTSKKYDGIITSLMGLVILMYHKTSNKTKLLHNIICSYLCTS